MSAPFPTGDFDMEAVVDEARAVAGESLLVVAVYDPKRYAVVYLDESVEGGYSDIDEVFEVGDDLHKHLYVDYLEQSLVGDMHPSFGSARAFVTYLDGVVLVRVVDPGANVGVLVALDPDAAVTPVVEAIHPTTEAEPAA